jgi:hypothetical protein
MLQCGVSIIAGEDNIFSTEKSKNLGVISDKYIEYGKTGSTAYMEFGNIKSIRNQPIQISS